MTAPRCFIVKTDCSNLQAQEDCSGRTRDAKPRKRSLLFKAPEAMRRPSRKIFAPSRSLVEYRASGNFELRIDADGAGEPFMHDRLAAADP